MRQRRISVLCCLLFPSSSSSFLWFFVVEKVPLTQKGLRVELFALPTSGQLDFRSAHNNQNAGLVVMGDDSCSRGRGLESQPRILDRHFKTLICCKNYINLFEKTKNKPKEAGKGQFFIAIKTWQLTLAAVAVYSNLKTWIGLRRRRMQGTKLLDTMWSLNIRMSSENKKPQSPCSEDKLIG